MEEEVDRMKFINYFETFKTFNATKYDEILVHLHSYAIKYGLEDEDMSLIATVSFQQNLGYMRIRKLLMCLVPRKFCSKNIIKMIIIQLLEHREGSKLIIKQYLQWLIGVIEFNLVESNDYINMFYDQFIYFLKFEIIDVPAAKLVYFLTTPDDVSMYFTQRINKLYKYSNGGRHFAALLYLFKCYRPDLVPENVPMYSPHKSFGKMSTGILQSLLCAKTRIQKNYQSSNNPVWNKFGVENIASPKMRGINSVPESYGTIKDFVLSSETSCVLSLINTPIGIYLIKFGSKITQERFSYQLYFVLYDVFLERNKNISYENRDKILQKIATLQNNLQQPVPVVSKFIGQFLMRWDGFEHQENILNILEWMYVTSFTELKQCVLTYLLHIFKTNDVETKCRILYCLGNFTANIIMSYEHRESDGIQPILFDIGDQISYPEFIKQLFLFMESLCLLAMLMERNHPAILNTIVLLHEKMLVAGTKAKIEFQISRTIPYTALLSTVPNALNAVCRLMNKFPVCVPLRVKQEFLDCLSKCQPTTQITKKGAIFKSLNRKTRFSARELELRLQLDKHYAFISHTYLLYKSSEESSEVLWNTMKRSYIDIFKFLQKHG